MYNIHILETSKVYEISVVLCSVIWLDIKIKFAKFGKSKWSNGSAHVPQYVPLPCYCSYTCVMIQYTYFNKI